MVNKVGRLTATRRGHAFVTPVGDDASGDYFVPRQGNRGAFHGDLVLVEEIGGTKGRRRRRPTKSRRASRSSPEPEFSLPEARVVDVVRRRESLVRGRFRALKDGDTGGVVEPIERRSAPDVHISSSRTGGARDGQKVLVRLLSGWSRGVYPRGEVVHVVTEEGSYDSDLAEICAEFGLDRAIPRSAVAEAEGLGDEISEEIMKGREDLRQLWAFTIDPEDAKDFDDAVSLERLPKGGWRLGVHIADVSTFVPPGSVLDEMARARGTSVYLPGTVIPMLPERISNNLASLRPGEDRLTKTVFIDFDGQGAPGRSRIVRSVIRSVRRFTYDEVLAILAELGKFDAGGLPLPPDCEAYRRVLADMARLRDRLHRRRLKRGCFEMDIPTVRLDVDRSGEVQSISRDVRDPSHHLIEEFMLAANEAVARYLIHHELPLVSRTHDEPEKQAIKDFLEFLSKVDPRLARFRRPEQLKTALEKIAGEPYASAAYLQFLRSLSHAEYSARPGLHYALATPAYCHFTSPIRRYPDLLVHQILDQHLTESLNAKRSRSWKRELPSLAVSSSERERRAERAEREMVRLRLIRHVQDLIGKKLIAVVTTILPAGLFVQVEDMLFEGFLPLSRLSNDYYDFDEKTHRLRGRQKKNSIGVGDRLRVILAEANPDLREIVFDFEGKMKR